MKRRIKPLIPALMVLGCTSSFADSYTYLATGAAKFDGEESAQSLGLGIGFAIKDWIGVELNITNFGHVDDQPFNSANIDVKSDVLSVAAYSGWEVTPDITVTGKLGLDAYELHTRIIGSGSASTNTEEGVAPYLAVGARYKLGEKWGAMAEYQLHSFDLGDDSFSMTNFMVGVELRY